MSKLFRKENTVIVEGDLYDFRRLLSLVHAIIEKAKFDAVFLDFSSCTSAFQNSMLSVCAQVMAYREAGIEFALIPPKKKQLANLFQNANWAYLIDPHNNDSSKFRGYTRIPATQYKTPTEQNNSVNKIVNVILGAIPDMQRSDFAAFEWAINELTDNVLVHSDSKIGGLIQVSTFLTKQQVQFVVADAGVGIPNSLRQGHEDIGSDTDALDKAIREGVTRDKSIGQGNGLFGSYQICSTCRGNFSISSGHGQLDFKDDKKKSLSITDERIPYGGTLITATIDFSESGLLEKALKLKGKTHRPVDIVETQYEKNEDGNIYFKLIDHSSSFGSRVAGKPIRVKLSNLLRMSQPGKIILDLEGVPLMSSSFADEAFGKLFLEAGALTFMNKFEFVNVMETVKSLIDKAIAQRMSVGITDKA